MAWESSSGDTEIGFRVVVCWRVRPVFIHLSNRARDETWDFKIVCFNFQVCAHSILRIEVTFILCEHVYYFLDSAPRDCRGGGLFKHPFEPSESSLLHPKLTGLACFLFGGVLRCLRASVRRVEVEQVCSPTTVKDIRFKNEKCQSFHLFYLRCRSQYTVPQHSQN